MQEKDMVNDALSSLNSGLSDYQNIIVQAADPQFRQTIQQLRNNCETTQYNLYKLAEQKGYYHAAQMADQQDIQKVKQMFGQ